MRTPSPAADDPARNPVPSTQEACGSSGLVTSPHTLASLEGRRVLAEGGNAIEAAIAMGAVLAVVYPHFNGLGGDAVWIVADARGRSKCFLGIGQAVRNCSGYEAGVPVRGARSTATTACLVDSWGHAHEYARANWAGRMAFGALLDRAVELAEGGILISSSQRFWLDFRRGEWESWPGFARIFGARDGGRFVQCELGKSLRTIAEEGPRTFYEGCLAQRIAKGLREAGSPLELSDLMLTRTRTCDPIALDYAGHALLAPPPPTQGVTTLVTMGVLERLGIAGATDGSADYYHLIVEAIKQAFLLRDDISDPDFAPQPVEQWLSEASLRGLASKVDRKRALPWPSPFRTGDTVYLAAVDAEGRSASVLQSIYFDWGSGTVAGGTGIVWQNRAAAFSAGINALRPGARPFYTLNPGIAMKDGRPRILYGTQGADGQPQTLAALLPHIINHGLGPAAALAGPRFLLGRTFSDDKHTLKLEEGIGSAVLVELHRRGHDVATLVAGSPLSGQAGLIVVDDGVACGAHDPRSDGMALAVG